METKKIANIVFYKSFNNNLEERAACIFYNDGSVVEVSYDEGLTACEEIVKERKITSKDIFKEMINKEIVHVMSKSDFEKNFKSFITVDYIKREEIEESVEEKLEEAKENNHEEEKAEEKENNESHIPAIEIIPDAEDVAAEEKDDEIEIEDFDDDFDDDLDDFDFDDDFDDEIEEEEKLEEEKPGFFKRIFDKLRKNKIVVKLLAIGTAIAIGLGLYSCAKRNTKEGIMLNSNIQTSSLNLDNNSKEQPMIEKNENNEVIIRGLDNSTDVTAEKEVELEDSTAPEVVEASPIVGNNDLYDGYTYDQLLEVTNNETQKTAMMNVKTAIEAFNGPFADAHMEEGKDIRAALSFDEIVALQQAYNDYSKSEIRAIFNGSEIRSDKMTRAYKDASLQLMGAHVIETREHPVDMSVLLETEEGKAFYQRYHEMFLEAKEATGEEKLAKINAFYKAVKEDFPITEEVRTEGIAHADDYETITAYKLSVTPMIAAAEMMFQNYEIDYTLTDSQIDFLNDIGLCNYADKTFERIETISLTACEEDNTNPLYEQYRAAIIEMMTERGQYVIDDEHRELSRLDAFQNAVNWHFDIYGDWTYTGTTIESTQTYQETRQWTEQTTTTREETTRTEGEITDEARAEIDAEIERENEEARRRAEEEAENERRRLQEEEDQRAEQIRIEIEQEEQDMQERIEDANDQIEQNHDSDPTNDRPVNEADFGDHNVDFDDAHSDENGNLDDSVENITTDGTGDQTGEDLPDPNATGEEFDRRGTDMPVQVPMDSPQAEYVEEYEEPAQEAPQEQYRVEDPVVEQPTYEEPVVEQPTYEEPAQDNSNDGGHVEYVDDNNYIEYPSDYTPVVEYEEPAQVSAPAPSNEEIVDEYVEAMAADPEEEAFEYTR